jgi:hypothetical protein
MSAIDPVLSVVAALGTALLFAAAAAHKLSDWPRFRAAVGNYRIAPQPLVPALAIAVVAIEITAAELLLLPASRPAGALLAAGLLAAYAAAIGVNLRRGRSSIDCGCMGAGSRRPIGPWIVTRNLIMAIFVLAAALPATSRPLVALDALTIGGALACLGILYAGQDALQRNAARPGPGPAT